MLCHGGCHILKADMPDGNLPTPVSDNGNTIPRVVRANPRWVIAVIGSEQKQIVGSRLGQNARYLCIKPFQCTCISADLAGVALQAVKFDKIREGQAVIFGLIHQIDQVFHQFPISAFAHLINALHREDIANLSNGINPVSGLLNPIGHSRARRTDGKIFAVLGPAKISAIAGKGTCNHPANFHGVQCWGQIFAKLQ